MDLETKIGLLIYAFWLLGLFIGIITIYFNLNSIHLMIIGIISGILIIIISKSIIKGIKNER